MALISVMLGPGKASMPNFQIKKSKISCLLTKSNVFGSQTVKNFIFFVAKLFQKEPNLRYLALKSAK